MWAIRSDVIGTGPTRARKHAGAWLAAAAVLALLPAAQAAALQPPAVHRPDRTVHPVAVFGSDDRQPVPPRYDAVAQAVGILFNNRTRTVCTAFCVSDTVVATAAHCLANAATGQSNRAADFVFARHHDRAKDRVRVEGFATRSAAQNVVMGNFALRVRPPIDAAHDWALMRLARPACTKHELTLRVFSPAELIAHSRAGHVFQISYHRDFTQWKAAYSKPCEVARDFDNAEWSTIAPDFLEAERMILHTCDTGGASSGSPLLVDTAEGPVVAGSNVGIYVQSKVVMQNGQMTHRHRAETVANTAVNASAFADRVGVLRNAHILASGNPMKTLQERLRQHQFYGGRLDGTYGPALRTAIEAYEKANTLPVTGLATQGLLLRLSGEQAPQAEQETAAHQPARRGSRKR